MNLASKYAYIKKKAAPSKPKARRASGEQLREEAVADVGLGGGLFGDDFDDAQEVDTNVLSINFQTLKQAEDNIQMGDASLCKGCKSCFSSVSKLYSKTEYNAKYDTTTKTTEEKEKEVQGINLTEKEESKDQEEKPKDKNVITTPIAEMDKIWVCEFCGVHNVLNLEDEEIPKTDDVIYLLKSAEQINKNLTNLASDITTIFCIDNSGSMSYTQEIKGKHDFKHGISPEEYEMLKQFIEYGADQYLPNQKRDTTFVTRKQCVLAAIENQLLELKADYPNRKVGLVTFDNDVSLIGDGKNVPEIITGDKLYKYDVLTNMAKDLSDKLISTSVKESAEALIKKFEKLNESGKTALGPALLASINMAIQQKQGSRVILCTDGLANIGLGEMDTEGGLAKAEEFYTGLANLAKENGISVSIVTIKGEGCKLDLIGKLADITSGTLTRVDPNEITNKFANIMKQEVIGTQVEVKLRLHRGMKFRNEQEDLLKEQGSLYEKNVGNITAGTELTFEYEVRADEQLSEFGIDLTALDTVPFQAQIIYNSTTGDKLMRVISKKVKTTKNLEEAEKEVNVNVMATRAVQHQAQFAQAGHYAMSNQVGSRWGGYFNSQQQKNANFGSQADAINSYQNMNYKMQDRATKQMEKKSKKSSGGLFGSHQQAQPQAQAQPTGLFSNAPSSNYSSNNTFGAQPKGGQAQPGGLFSKAKDFFFKKEEKAPMTESLQKQMAEEAEDDDEAYEVFHEARNAQFK